MVRGAGRKGPHALIRLGRHWSGNRPGQDDAAETNGRERDRRLAELATVGRLMAGNLNGPDPARKATSAPRCRGFPSCGSFAGGSDPAARAQTDYDESRKRRRKTGDKGSSGAR